jgi:signal transduction histidine kinase
LAEFEKERVVSQERTRIMRDMHDGVGMHLSSALRQIQSGHYGAALVEQTLRDSLDHLKLTVDSMNFHAGDVGALLGSLRYRLGPRLEAVGLNLLWDVPDLPSWPGGNVENLRHVQYIVFEALSNALQHTQATELRLSARSDAQHMEVSVVDNGVGYDPKQLSQGKGIRGMQQRADILGASLQWLPVSPQGCQVLLRLPMSPGFGAADLAGNGVVLGP